MDGLKRRLDCVRVDVERGRIRHAQEIPCAGPAGVKPPARRGDRVLCPRQRGIGLVARGLAGERGAPRHLVEVALPAGSLLEVRLQEIRRARPVALRQRGTQAEPVPADPARHPGGHAIGEGRVACDQPCGKEGRCDRDVGAHGVDLARWCPHLVSHVEAGVPERVDDPAHERLEVARGAVRDHEQIHVRARQQPTRTVTAKREERERPPQSRRSRPGKRQDGFVGQVGECACGLGARYGFGYERLPAGAIPRQGSGACLASRVCLAHRATTRPDRARPCGCAPRPHSRT